MLKGKSLVEMAKQLEDLKTNAKDFMVPVERMKMETGLSPINFLIKIRINIAMNLMAHFNYKIGDIAYETGFYSPQHFSLTFKKMTGVSPHKYRKTYYEKQL